MARTTARKLAIACTVFAGLCVSPVAARDQNDAAPPNCINDPGICYDHNACTTDYCNYDNGECQLTPVVCGDGNPCTADSCDPDTGCVFTPATGPCDDGDDCTSADQCNGGMCAGTPSGSSPGEVGASVRVHKAGVYAHLTWTAGPLATNYEVLRGSASELPVGPSGGDAAEGCIAYIYSGLLDYADPTMPPSGVAAWYLIRGRNACGAGGYGFAEHNGMPAGPRLSTVCP